MKKLGIILLTSVLVLTLMITAFAVPSKWAKAEVDEARTKNLIVAEADQNYQDFITRELFCKLVVRMVEQQNGAPVEITITNPFTDTTNLEIIKAYQLGIVKGISETQFAPNNLITRQEVAIMMMRAFRVLDQMKGTSYTQNVNISGLVFNDESSIASWAVQDVKEAFVLGIIKGVGDNTMNPLGNTTIEQSILLSVRLFNRFGPSSAVETTGTVTTTLIPAVPTTMVEVSTTLATVETTIATATEETTEPPVSTNNPPIAKAADLVVNIRHEQKYKILASDIANDPDGDELSFVSFKRKSTFGIVPPPYFNISMDESRNLVIESEQDVSVDQTAAFEAVVTDGEDNTTIEFDVKVRGKNLEYIQTFEPTVLNVQLDQSITRSMYKYVDLKNGVPIDHVDIIPAEESDFGQLTYFQNLLGNYYIKFIGKSSETLINKTKKYKVSLHLSEGIAEIEVIVKYGRKTYSTGLIIPGGGIQNTTLDIGGGTLGQIIPSKTISPLPPVNPLPPVGP